MATKTTKIKSAKIVKDKTLSVNLIEEHAKTTKELDVEIHPDLKKSFQNLHAHLAILCGYVETEDVEDIKTGSVENFHVRGFSISAKEDGVVLMGHFINSRGKAVILNTPFTRFEQDEETQYEYIDDLVEKLDRAKKEVNAYLFEGKKADDPQGVLFKDGEDAGGVGATQHIEPVNQEQQN